MNFILFVTIIWAIGAFSDDSTKERYQRDADLKLQRFQKRQEYLQSVETGRGNPKNMILFIGDGMSMATITAARYLKSHGAGNYVGDPGLAWEDWDTVSLMRTFNKERMTTDSASAATAMLTGTKVGQSVVSLAGTVKCCECVKYPQEAELQSILLMAQKVGLRTGIVTTTRITHATPAAAYANSVNRNTEFKPERSNSVHSNFTCPDIASQLISKGHEFNVVLGGGAAYFQPTDKRGRRTDERDLIYEWQRKQSLKKRKYKAVMNTKDLLAVDANSVDYLLGLITPDDLPYDVERNGTASLAEMTTVAVNILKRNEKGFLLLVEGGRIDHGHHMNNAKYALMDTLALEETVKTVQSLVDINSTLMVVTADHAHTYGIVGTAYRNQSVLDIAEKQAQDGMPFLISNYHNGPGGSINASRSNPATANRYDNRYRQQALVPLDMSTHAAEDVPLYATGPWNQLFAGSMDNTYVARAAMFVLCLGHEKNASHCTKSYTPNEASHRDHILLHTSLVLLLNWINM